MYLTSCQSLRLHFSNLYNTLMSNIKYPRLFGHRDHPIANAGGVVRVHRLMLWNKLQGKDSQCHWCDKDVHWFSKPRLIADHLDRNTHNNAPENLVPACQRCNSSRDRKWFVPGAKKSAPCGTIANYMYGCRCNECKKTASIYNKAHRKPPR